MLNKVFNFFFKEPSDIDFVLRILDSNLINNIAETDPVKDSVFYVGRNHVVRFSSDGECALYFKKETVPLFVFDNAEDVSEIRTFIINKLNVNKLDPLLYPNKA